MLQLVPRDGSNTARVSGSRTWNGKKGRDDGVEGANQEKSRGREGEKRRGRGRGGGRGRGEQSVEGGVVNRVG